MKNLVEIIPLAIAMIAIQFRCLMAVLMAVVLTNSCYSQAVFAGEVRYSTDFESPPLNDNWKSSGVLVETAGWSLDRASSGSHSLKIGPDDTLTTPVIRGEIGDFYRIRFSATGEGVGYGPQRFQIDLSPDWTSYEAFFRSPIKSFSRNFRSTSQQPYYIDDFSIETATDEDFRGWADNVYADLNQQITLPNQPDPYRWLPQTMSALAQGQNLRVVMLGDSIVNDTFESYWDSLVEAHYPGSDIQTIKAVRSSTGAWWYKEENRVQQWVLDHDPDLVMIGGISHREDVESIREVVQQIRAGSDTEILVMTGVAGNQSIGDPRILEQWEFDIDPDSSDYRSRLLKMAGEEQIGFVDLRASWGQFILESELPYEYYMRDLLHMNHRGQQIVARSLEEFFANFSRTPNTLDGRGQSYRQSFDSLGVETGAIMPQGWSANSLAGRGREILSLGLEQGSLENIQGVVNVGGNPGRFGDPENASLTWQEDLDGNGFFDAKDVIQDAAEDRALGIARSTDSEPGQLIFESTIVNDRLKAFTLAWDLEVWGADPREEVRGTQGAGFQVEVSIAGKTYLQQSHSLTINGLSENSAGRGLDTATVATLIDGNLPNHSLRNLRSGIIEVDPRDGAEGELVRVIFDANHSTTDSGWISAVDNIELFALAAGDVDGDGDIDPFDITKILIANKFGKGLSNATWEEGDFDQDDDVDPLDIMQILIAIQNKFPKTFAADNNLHLRPQLTVNPRNGSLTVDTKGLDLLSLVIDSQAGIFQGSNDPHWQSSGEFSTDGDFQISRTSFNISISGVEELGDRLLAQIGPDFDLRQDINFSYLVAGEAKIREGMVVILLPEPSTAALLLLGGVCISSVLVRRNLTRKTTRKKYFQPLV